MGSEWCVVLVRGCAALTRGYKKFDPYGGGSLAVSTLSFRPDNLSPAPHPRNRTGNGAWRAVFGGSRASLRDARAFAWPIHGVDFCFHGMDFPFHGMFRPIHGVFPINRWDVFAAIGGRIDAVLPCQLRKSASCSLSASTAGRAVRVAEGRRPLCLASRALSPFFGKSPPSPPRLPCFQGAPQRAPRGAARPERPFFQKNGRAQQRFRKIT